MRFPGTASADAPENVKVDRDCIVTEMQMQHPGLRLKDIDEIAYTKSSLHPMYILEQGGFVPQSRTVSLNTAKETLPHEGLLDFSLVPEAAAIPSQKLGAEEYIYAAPVDKGYLPPESQKRQVFVPALPLPEFFIAREVVERNDARIKLGEPIVIGDIPKKFAKDEGLLRFQSASHLEVPQDIGLGDENYPAVYRIKKEQETPASKRLYRG